MHFELNQYCELFYASHYVPIALYADTERIACYSSLDKPLDLSIQIQALLSHPDKNPDVFALQEQGQYGLIRVNGSAYSILVGPVFSSPVTEDTILAVARNHFVPSDELDTLGASLAAIPNYTYNQFLNLIAYLHYSLNQERFDIIKHFHTEGSVYQQILAPIHTENSYLAKEYQEIHGTYHFENTLLSYIRDGEVDKLNDFLQQTVNSSELREGTLADTPLRQAKNLFLGLVVMVGKIGAIGGGMDVEETYRLIDLYNQECEKAPSVDAVKLLQYHMILDFTERVAQCKIPQNVSREIFSCIQFIQNHTNFSIGINDVTKYIRRSRAWLTKNFRRECGITITEFITQSKIRDAKRLLRYSDKSLEEISNYLCFSSQAYFQTVFKKNTGITPKEYRQKHVIVPRP